STRFFLTNIKTSFDQTFGEFVTPGRGLGHFCLALQFIVYIAVRTITSAFRLSTQLVSAGGSFNRLSSSYIACLRNSASGLNDLCLECVIGRSQNSRSKS